MLMRPKRPTPRRVGGGYRKTDRRLVSLSPYHADFTRVKTFGAWEYHAKRLADVQRGSGWWVADAALWMENAFGYSPSTGRLIYTLNLPEHERRGFRRIEYQEIAVWMGIAPRTLYNYLRVGRAFPPHERGFLEGLKVSISDIAVTLRGKLTLSDSHHLAHEYANALRGGGYGVDSGDHTQMIPATREELANRAKALEIQAPHLPQAVNAKPKLHKHNQWRTLTVPKVRALLESLDIPTDSLPPDHWIHPETGEIFDRLITLKVDWSWLE